MRSYNISEVKTQLSKLVERAAKGESFVIAKAGKPMVEVVPLNVPESARVKDFNPMGSKEILKRFRRRK